MAEERTRRAAVLLRDARLARRPIGPLPADCRPTDLAEAYRIQEQLNVLLDEAGRGELTGHKIGCTTPVMQAYMKIPHPCAGEVFGATVFEGHGRFRAADHLRPGVECEIAVRLDRDLESAGPGGGAGFDRETVARAVGACMASIEIVDDRYHDYPTLGTPTLVADDFFNAGCVLGPAVTAWRELDLVNLRGRMLVNGAPVGEGRGGDILGHPLDALAWLAGNLAERGRPLRAGTFVSLGSIVTTQWIGAGDDVRIELEGLGEARATFV